MQLLNFWWSLAVDCSGWIGFCLVLCLAGAYSNTTKYPPSIG